MRPSVEFSGDNVHLLFFQRSIEQPQIHDARLGGEAQSIGVDEPVVAVGPLHEFVTEAGAPPACVRRQVGDGAQAQASGVAAAYHNREGVIESQRRSDFEVESIPVAFTNAPVHGSSVARGRLAENGREGRPRILGVQIHLVRQQRLMANKCAAKIEPAVHAQCGVRFDLLRQEFAKNNLLGKILGPDNDRACARAAARCQCQQPSTQQPDGFAAIEENLSHHLVITAVSACVRASPTADRLRLPAGPRAWPQRG